MTHQNNLKRFDKSIDLTAFKLFADKLLVFQRELDVLEGHLNDAIKMKGN